MNTEVKEAKALYKARMRELLGDNWKVLSKKLGIYNIPKSQEAINQIKDELRKLKNTTN